MFRSPTKLRTPVYLAARLAGVALFAGVCLLTLALFANPASTADNDTEAISEDPPAVVLH